MINLKKIVKFSMPKRLPKKQKSDTPQVKDDEENQTPIKQQEQNDIQKVISNQGDEDFWVDCNK
jgi:hypothetical protein